MTARLRAVLKLIALPAIVGLALAGTAQLTAAVSNNEKPPPNLPAPTMGGQQFWTDLQVFAGWRIQENFLTGHFRLLNPRDVRQAWGSLADCRKALARLKQEKGIAPSSDHLVLLVHGIAPRIGAFSAMQESLRKAGYDAVAISYASTRRPIEAHADGLETVLNGLEGTKTVSFVTHSMGGLVVRDLLARDGAWKDRIAVHRVVMIAPPNQGSAVARVLKDVGLYEALYGPAGQQLVPEEAARRPPLTYPFGIIAGGKGDAEGFNPLVPGDDDGTVIVEETRLEGESDFLLLPQLHATITSADEAIAATKRFLASGCFAPCGE